MCYTYPRQKKKNILYRVERKQIRSIISGIPIRRKFGAFFIVCVELFGINTAKQYVHTRAPPLYSTSRRSLILIVISA